MNRITFRRVAGLAAATALAVMALAGVAAADGTRSLSLGSVGGVAPQAGTPFTLVVRLDEGGHPVSGAQVTAAVTPVDVDAAPATAIPAAETATPGEYHVTVAFSDVGSWRVWLVADEGGQRTETAYDVDVATASAVPGEPAGSTHDMESMPGMEGQHSMENMPGMESSGAVEPGSVDPHAGDAVAGAATADGHSDSEEAAGGHTTGGEVNWWVIGGFLAVIGAGIAAAAGLKQRLRRQMTSGALATESGCDV
ncbi:MAG: FixH family protein [Thermoleophilia bacterium]